MIYEVNKILKNRCDNMTLKSRKSIMVAITHSYNRIIQYPELLAFGSYVKMLDSLTLEYKSFEQLVISIAACFVLIKSELNDYTYKTALTRK